ncbi:MAG: hypothetical protein NTW29_19655 [Bacteroidetes bacterium]|nr:hypothetical protein [Bacteroidota bacterium]
MARNLIRHFLCFFSLLMCLSMGAQNVEINSISKSGSDISVFIPSGYDTMMTAKGDLNKDGVEDVVLCLKNFSEDSFDMDEEPKRILLVLIKKNNEYVLKGKSVNALMCRHCGGIFGDPFSGVAVEKGILMISHYGGSAWRWTELLKFRYQENGFYLIGTTSDYFWNVSDCNGKGAGESGRKYKDVNCVTGDTEIIEKDENCRLLVHKKKRLNKKPLVKLEKFKYDF